MSSTCTAPIAVTAESFPQYPTAASDTAPCITRIGQRSRTGAWSLRLRVAGTTRGAAGFGRSYLFHTIFFQSWEYAHGVEDILSSTSVLREHQASQRPAFDRSMWWRRSS